MATTLTDLETAQLNEKYESYRREIDALKRKIQEARKRQQNNAVLRSEFDKRIIQEKKAANANAKTSNEENNKNNLDPQNNNNNNNINNINNIDPQTKYKLPNELSSLKCYLSEYKKLSGHGNKVYGVDWIKSSDIVSVGRDGKLIFWNADTGYKRLAYPLDTEFIMTLAYSPNGKHVACGGLDDMLSIFEVKDNETGIYKDIEPQIYKSHTGYISCLQYIDNNTILTSSGDATIRQWDIEYNSNNNNNNNNNAPTYTYKVHREDVMSISINPKNKSLLLSGSVDSTAKIIDLRIKPEEKENYNGDKNVTHSFYMGYDQDLSKKNRTTDVNVVKWFPDGISFVAGCDDGTVRLLDMRSNRLLNEYSYHKNYLKETQNQTLNLQDTNDSNNSMVRTSTNTPIITHLNHDHDKMYDHKNNINQELEHKAIEPLKASDEDAEEFEYDIEPTDGVATLDFSNSGAFMFVSYNNDKHKVLAWNMLTGEVVQELKHEGHVPSLVVSPDGTKLVTACWDHHIKLWA